MRVALISGSAGDGRCGVGDYNFELAQHLALDAEVTLYHARGHGPSEPAFEKLTSLEIKETTSFSALTIAWLAKKIAAEGFDIVHLQYPSKGYGNSVGPGFLPQRLAGMHSRSRILVTLHEWVTSHPLRKSVMDQMLPAADTIIVTNEAEMGSLVKRSGGKRVEVIPVGNVLTSRSELEAVWLVHEGREVPLPAAPAGPAGRKPNSIFHYGLPARGKGFQWMLGALKLVREAGVQATLELGGDFSPGTRMSEDVLGLITEHGLTDCVHRLGHLQRGEIAAHGERCCLGVFPFDEGYSSKRSSIAGISHLDLPLVVGAGSREEHPFYAPEENTEASLAVLLVELLSGRLEQEWAGQVTRQREYAGRFSFSAIARQHMDTYSILRNTDV